MKPFYRWLVVLAIILTIAFLSSQPAKEQKDIRPYLRSHPQVVEYLQKIPQIKFYYTGSVIDSKKNPIRFWGFFVPRKAFHFLSYGCFGLVLVWAWRGCGIRGWRSWFLALIMLALVASLDELNQLMEADRTGAIDDVFLDLTGFLVIGSIASLMGMFRTRKRLDWVDREMG